MPTKTEEYLRILAEGGDAPTDCCMTNTQALIAEAIERINNLGGGDIVDLTPYFDMQTFTLDVEEVVPLIEEGGHIYSLTIPGQGEDGMTIYFSGASIVDDQIQFTGIPLMTRSGTSESIGSYNFAFDASTGAMDPSSIANSPAVSFDITQGGVLKLQSLTINIGSDTYEYDGSQSVNITIADGENMGF